MSNCWDCRKQYELNSLRAEVERFESGREYAVLQEKYDKEHIKVLELENKLKDYKTCKQIPNRLKKAEEKIERLEKVIAAKDAVIKEWKEKYKALEQPYINALKKLEETKANDIKDDKNDETVSTDPTSTEIDQEQLKNEITDLKAQLKAKEAQLRNDNTNCSIPSSMCLGRSKIPNNREPSDRDLGGQPGHKGHRRTALKPDVIVKLKVTDEILKNPAAYKKTGKTKVKQIQSIRLIVQVIQYEAEVYKRLSDGKKVSARFPHGIVNDITYDASIKALACILHSHGNMSYDKVRVILSELTDGKLNLSTGFLNGLEREFSDKTVIDRQHIWDRMLRYPFMHVDGTTIYVNGKRRTILVCTSPAETLYFYSENKGHKAVKKSVLKDYKGIVISDGESTFFNYGTNHQGCIEHELRYLQGSVETEVNLTWAGKMRSLLKKAIHIRNEAKRNGLDHLEEETIKEIESKYDEYLELAETEYQANPKQIQYYKKGYNTMIRLRDHKQYYLLFLHDFRIPPTNSRAEQKARPAKMHVKQSGGYRDEDGLSVQYYCNTVSLMECTADRNGSRYRMILSVFKRSMPEDRESKQLQKKADEAKSATTNNA